LLYYWGETAALIRDEIRVLEEKARKDGKPPTGQAPGNGQKAEV